MIPFRLVRAVTNANPKTTTAVYLVGDEHWILDNREGLANPWINFPRARADEVVAGWWDGEDPRREFLYWLPIEEWQEIRKATQYTGQTYKAGGARDYLGKWDTRWHRGLPPGVDWPASWTQIHAPEPAPQGRLF
jgi:hypothetical protein